MKVKDLIKKLEKLPKNAQVLLWEGFNGEYIPRMEIDLRGAGRVKYPNEKAGPWEDEIPSFIHKEYIQLKDIVCIQGINKGKRLEGR